MTEFPDYRMIARSLTTSVLTLEFDGREPGIIEPSNADAYAKLWREAFERIASGAAESIALHLVGVSREILEFAAGRGPEAPTDLLQAYARSLAHGGPDGDR